MNENKIRLNLEKVKSSNYVMDKSLVWFFWRYGEYKNKFNEFKETKIYSDDERINRMRKDMEWISLSYDLMGLQTALLKDINIILTGKFYGETIKIKNQLKELELRRKLLKEIDEEKEELNNLKPYKEKLDAEQEIQDLKKRLEKLEKLAKRKS